MGRDGRKERKKTQRGKLVGGGFSSPGFVRQNCPPFLRFFPFFAAIHEAGRARGASEFFSD